MAPCSATPNYIILKAAAGAGNNCYDLGAKVHGRNNGHETQQ